MPKGFRAVMHHSLRGADLQRLQHVLNVQWQDYGRIWPIESWTQPHMNQWAWRREPGYADLDSQLESYGYLRLRGPSDFAAIVGRRAFELSHSTSWDQFFADTTMVQEKLRGTVRLLCGDLGSPAAVYFPADASSGFVSQLVREGESMNDILTWLSKNFGLPHKSIQSMLTGQGDSCEVHGYFIDDFESHDRLAVLEAKYQQPLVRH